MTRVTKQVTTKRLPIYFLSLIAAISIILLPSSIGYSLEELQMKVQYKTDQGTEQTWDLKKDHAFNQAWFTKKDNVSFTVDLSHYYKEEFEGETVPFEVYAKHNEADVTNVTVKQTSPFTGVYDVSFDLAKKDGNVDITLSIKEENEWNIPGGHNPMTFTIKRDTTAPAVEITGVKDNGIYVPDNNDKPQLPVFNIAVTDENIDTEKVFAIVNNKETQLKKQKDTDNIFRFDSISEDGIYKVKFVVTDKNNNTTTTDEMTIHVHNDLPKMKIDVDSETIENGEPILNNKATTLSLSVENTIPIEDIVVDVTKDGKTYNPAKNEVEVNKYQGKWTYTFEKEGQYVIHTTVKDRHDGKLVEHSLDSIELEINKNKPIIELDGIEHGLIYHADDNGDTLHIKVKDRIPLLNTTYIMVNGKRHPIFLNSKGEASYTFDKDGKYDISVTTKNIFFNESTTDEMTFYLHQQEIERHVFVNEKEIKEDTFFYNGEADIEMKVNSTIPFKGVDVEVEKDGETYQTISSEITENVAVWKNIFKDEGDYTVDVKATDANEIGDTHTHLLDPIEFTIDTTKPVISISENEAGAVQDDISQGKHITVEVTEKNFAKEKANITVLNEDNKPVEVNFSPWEIKAGTKDTYVSDFEFTKDGTYTVLVDVEDNATNKATNQTALFAIDTIEPAYKVSGIKDQAHYKQGRQVDVVIQDEHIDQNNTFITAEKWNSTKHIYESYDIGEIDFEDAKSAALHYLFEEDATYKLTLHAIDLSGNELDPVTYEFTIDTIAPEVTVKNVKDDTFYNEAREVAFSVIEHNFKTNNVHFKVTRDGKDITREVEREVGSEWKQASESTTLSYLFEDDGEYHILFKAIDHAGNASKNYDMTFTIDGTDPVITIGDVEDSVHYAQTKKVQIDIIDRNLEDHTIAVTKNGEKYDIGKVKVDENEAKDIVASITHSFSEEGEYEITVEASDIIANKSTKTVSFVIDKTNPLIQVENSINSHITKDVINKKGMNELINIYLKERYIYSKKVEVTRINLQGKAESISQEDAGKWVEVKQNEYTFELNNAPFQQDGTYTITVKVEDKAGSRATEQDITFTVDNIKPKITLSNMSRYNNKAVTQEITVEEHNFKQNNVEVEVFRENSKGKFELIKDTKQWKNEAKQTTLLLPFTDEGTYKVVVNATDDAGNKAAERSSLFTVDTISPTIKITGIDMTNQVLHYNMNKPVKVEINDQNINADTTKVEIMKLNTSTGKMERYNKHGSIAFTKTNASFTHNFTTKDEGTYRLKVTAQDKSGNRAQVQEVTFVIDETAPKLAITGVDNNAYYNKNSRVTVSVDEANYTTNQVTFSVLRNGQDITEQVERGYGSKWRTRSRLSTLDYQFTQDGFYEIKVSAQDAAGNKATAKSMQFTIDKTTPVIEITGVDKNEHYNTDKMVNVNIRDVNFKNNIIRVTRNGSAYNVGDFSVQSNKYADSFATLQHTFKAEGKYEIVVESVDQAGNSATNQIAFTIDKTAPVITPVMKQDGTVIKDGQYINKIFTPQFNLDEAEDEIISVTLNGGGNIVNKIPLTSKEMLYEFNVLARDKAGNETTMKISFTVDVTKPTLNISGILDGFFNNNVTPVVVYADKHLDEAKSFVTLNGQAFTSGTLLNKEGEYVLKAKITDLANNVSERTIVFTIDQTAPVIRFENELSGRYFNETIIPEIFIKDMSDYDIISLTLNGEPYTLGDPIEQEGKHVLYFEVKDKAGNIKQLTVEFIIDKTAPNVLISGVEHNKKYLEAMEVGIQLDNPEDTITEITVNDEVHAGELTEKDGNEFITLDFKDIGNYDIKVHASDEAGNETIEQVKFEIADKTIVNTITNNKTLLYGSIIGSLLLALLLVLLAVRKSKGKATTEDQAA